MSAQYWLSYGGGVNSTALAVLLARGALPQYAGWRVVFSDTGDERPETYDYIERHFGPWLASVGKVLEVVKPKETVLERWERLRVTGSRTLRGCTVEGKINPIKRYVEAQGGGVQLIGVDAGEAHRMPGRVRPLVDLDVDREGCESIIKAEGLPSPGKSGCWHCPFARVQEVVDLARLRPEKFARIKRLEKVATETHGPQPDGGPRTQWGDRPAEYWEQRARQGDLLDEFRAVEMPCGCFDGAE
ncbi:hypothetical protein [Acidovorax sp. SUPP2825]|uniref:hypothetical protein n=1 Tax=Acidovorax sp. SUPP2825 TaxID=2920879 RepID=UPI0023DE23B1|nr:hypothetical protein [Acidovorax sp. SUPP2825]GKS96763.1 phosphoadenosine phosphosulfate reductase family protein [Acidovorax sp. SUPP2825]